MLIARFDRMTARVHQVSLAQTYTAVQVKRVVSSSRSFSYGQRSSVSKLITRSDNKTLVGVFRT